MNNSGYMSPEYAMQGQFSEKSDVFSFGVLLLEIISGRRNTGFYLHEYGISLLGFVCLPKTSSQIRDNISNLVNSFYFLNLVSGMEVVDGRQSYSFD